MPLKLSFAGLPNAGSNEAISLLKLFIALHISNTEYVIDKSPSKFKKPTLYYNQDKDIFFEINAALRYLSNHHNLTFRENLLQNQLFEFEEQILLPNILKNTNIENNLKDLNSFFEQYLKEQHFKKFKPELISLFSSLYYYGIYHDQNIEKFSHVHQFFQHYLKHPVVSFAIDQTKENTLDINLTPRPEPSADNRKFDNTHLYTEDKTEKRPKKGERNILIASALPYVNNVPHLGNIIGAVLSADVFARYCRLRSYNVLYICGTDEYGTATETKALEEKISCKELCDKYHAIHSEVYKWFNISFDYFGRTTTDKQTEISQDIFWKLYRNGYIYEEKVTQLFCEACSRFLADRYVEGICPKCSYEDARGDQCDQCGSLLNATDLVSPRCKLDGNKPVLRESKHLFLDLPKLQSKCEEFVESSSALGKWTANGKLLTNGWLKEGLRGRCITRDLKWGTPVPLPGFENKVFYVWFDAPIGYLSITANYTEHWKDWWQNPEDVKLYQFMGKDNVPFHTIIFPCCLIGSQENWTFVHHLNTTEYLNYEGTKFSKSRNIGVFGNQPKETNIISDVWRFYLLMCRPETNDSSFIWKEFLSKNNNELLANTGNFCNRVLKFLDSSKYNGIVPEYDITEPNEQELIEDIQLLLSQYIEAMEQVKLRAALKYAMDISQRGNLYLQEAKVDNNLFAYQRKKCNTVVAVATNLIYLLAKLLAPFMPETSQSLCEQLNVPAKLITEKFSCDILPGHVIGKPTHLFTKIDETLESEFKAKYGGNPNVN